MTLAVTQTNRLRSFLQFDPIFIALPVISGIVFASACLFYNNIIATVAFINIWFLSYHHVISTYTRIAFDKKSVQENKFLVLALPPLVLAVTYAVYNVFGGLIIATVYFYWQWFHYTRQSYGISRYYLFSSGKPSAKLLSPINTVALYAVPVTGILYRSWQDNKTFLSMDLWNFPIPFEVVAISAVIAVLLLINQAYRWWKLYQNNELNPSYASFMISHNLMFFVGFILIENINIGWLAINVWHNMQYILFVWLQNNKKFKNGIDNEHPAISKLSQDGKMLSYMLACVIITIFIYNVWLSAITIVDHFFSLQLAAVLFMSLNFHHYIVDGIIWKRKRIKIAVNP